MKEVKAKAKTPSASETIKTEIVCPDDTNPIGILMGGKMVQWMDIAAAVCAQTHAEKICVTASIREVSFRQAAKLGDVVIIKAKLACAFTTSMEIFVQAFAHNVLQRKKQLISEAYFIFVALDEEAKATVVPPVKPVHKTEKELFDAAIKRRQQCSDIEKSQLTRADG